MNRRSFFATVSGWLLAGLSLIGFEKGVKAATQQQLKPNTWYRPVVKPNGELRWCAMNDLQEHGDQYMPGLLCTDENGQIQPFEVSSRTFTWEKS